MLWIPRDRFAKPVAAFIDHVSKAGPYENTGFPSAAF
jgi:hypothetical protein